MRVWMGECEWKRKRKRDCLWTLKSWEWGAEGENGRSLREINTIWCSSGAKLENVSLPSSPSPSPSPPPLSLPRHPASTHSRNTTFIRNHNNINDNDDEDEDVHRAHTRAPLLCAEKTNKAKLCWRFATTFTHSRLYTWTKQSTRYFWLWQNSMVIHAIRHTASLAERTTRNYHHTADDIFTEIAIIKFSV